MISTPALRERNSALIAVTTLLGALMAAVPTAAAAEPLRLHPDNPHYFLFRGKPTVLITSGEHYGAVLNLDFDYVSYLGELQLRGLNLTRVWPGGPYLEIPGSFNIANNTLAPAPNRFSCIWARSSTPGFAGGGNKFDLETWDESHITRLKDFVREASRRGVVVEVSFFCPYYDDALWNVSPLNPANNINGIGAGINRTDALTLKDSRLVAVQDAMVRKIVTELRDYDNLYYEICNEPYFAGVTGEWQDHITETILATEASFNSKHLIARNISNGSARVEKPHRAISIFNFHYSRPPDSVKLNYDLNKAIGLNETGFDGPEDATYRIQGWDFILAGGALYNNLDYSFTAEHEKGTFVPPATTPGGGSSALRQQLGILKNFIHSLDFIRMRPDTSFIKRGVPPEATVRALAEPGTAYAVYIHHGQAGYDHGQTGQRPRPPYKLSLETQQVKLQLELPAGSYEAEWLGTRSGRIERTERFVSRGNQIELQSPAYTEDIALRIKPTP
jgi:hypothetical protein